MSSPKHCRSVRRLCYGDFLWINDEETNGKHFIQFVCPYNTWCCWMSRRPAARVHYAMWLQDRQKNRIHSIQYVYPSRPGPAVCLRHRPYESQGIGHRPSITIIIWPHGARRLLLRHHPSTPRPLTATAKTDMFICQELHISST